MSCPHPNSHGSIIEATPTSKKRGKRPAFKGFLRFELPPTRPRFHRLQRNYVKKSMNSVGEYAFLALFSASPCSSRDVCRYTPEGGRELASGGIPSTSSIGVSLSFIYWLSLLERRPRIVASFSGLALPFFARVCLHLVDVLLS